MVKWRLTVGREWFLTRLCSRSNLMKAPVWDVNGIVELKLCSGGYWPVGSSDGLWQWLSVKVVTLWNEVEVELE